MDGLTNIISKINSDAKNECELIIAAAKKSADDILTQEKNSASDLKNKLVADANKKAELIKSKAVSGSELEYKRILLSEKCRIIDELLNESLDYIASLDDEAYFDLIKKLVLSNALSGNGVIFFNERDVNRMPSGFVDALCGELADDKNFKLSEKTVDCKAGFVIEYDDMRVDCTVESLISDKADEIKDELSKILF